MKYVPAYNLIMCADAPNDDKVPIIQGSGFGHEPAHTMIVGKGMLDAVVSDLPYQRGDHVALMINGLGGTPISELYLLYGIAHERLLARDIQVRRSYVGNYCTSLEMAGASLTLVKLDDELLELLNEPAEVAVRVF